MLRALGDIAAVVGIITMSATLGVRSMYAVAAKDGENVRLRDEAQHVRLTIDERRPYVGEATNLRVSMRGGSANGNQICLTPWWHTSPWDEVPRDGKVWCGPPYRDIVQPLAFRSPGHYVITLRLRTRSGWTFAEEHLEVDVR